jgi:hypothetical protein
MSPVQQLENGLNEVLNKKAPYQLPQSSRVSIAKALWVIALVFGALQVLFAWFFWRDGHRVNELVDWANSWSTAFGGQTTASHLGVFFYVTLGILAVDGALMLLAVCGLKTLKKSAWNLLFYSLLLNVVYGVVRMFSEYGDDVSYLFGSLISSAVGAYFLFQVRDVFMAGKAPVAPVAPKPPVAAPKA